MQSEIESLRRERVSLRAALADLVSMNDVGRMRAFALGVLVKLPATPPWEATAGTDPVARLASACRQAGEIGHGDVGAAGGGNKQSV